MFQGLRKTSVILTINWMLLKAQQLLSAVLLFNHKSPLEHFKTQLSQLITSLSGCPFSPLQWGSWHNIFGESWLLQKMERVWVYATFAFKLNQLQKSPDKGNLKHSCLLEMEGKKNREKYVEDKHKLTTRITLL